MAYAIRYNSSTHHGMLIEMDGRALAKIKREQDAADNLREAYWESENPTAPEPPRTYPYFDPIPATHAHSWVREGGTHETLLFICEGRIRRAGE